ncbi:MAG: hypothetical protein ACLQVI_11280 [Polyangiaceae bacterium]|jgi:hypothetical protein
MKAALLGCWLACAFAVLLAAHVALLVGLAQRPPRWRALVALVVPPLAPVWGWNEMPRRAHAWAIAFAAYAVVIVASQ